MQSAGGRGSWLSYIHMSGNGCRCAEEEEENGLMNGQRRRRHAIVKYMYRSAL